MYSFADNQVDDQDIVLFTKRLDTLLASASDFSQEAERLPASLELLGRDEHLSVEFRAAIQQVLDFMHKTSTQELEKQIKQAKDYLKRLNDDLSVPADSSSFSGFTGRQLRQQLTGDRDQQAELVTALEKRRKQKEKFPVRFTFQSFTDALEESGVFPEFYLLCLKNGFDTGATLRKILQSLLALWGFERQFTS